MKTSIIIPTYNGAEKLPAILGALEEQVYKDFEVIIVVDGSTDNTISVLQKSSWQLNWKYHYQENKGRSAVRNRGAELAKGDLLIFFDDDMYPLPDCIEKHVLHHAKHFNSILTGGLSENAKQDNTDITKYKSYLSNKWNKKLQRSSSGELSKNNIFITAANFSVMKVVFEQLQGFDERLKDAEDFDLAVRAYKSGVELYFKENVFAWHNDIITCKSYIKRQRQYTRAHMVLAEIKPWLVEEGFLKPFKKPEGLHKHAFRIFLNNFWIKFVDEGHLSLLPKNLRYKVYDLIITANGIFYPEKVQL